MSLIAGTEAIQNYEIEEQEWVKKNIKKNILAGDRYNYKCSKCPKTLYLLHCLDGSSSIFLEDIEHEHLNDEQLDSQQKDKKNGYRIPERTKQKVKELRNMMTPKQISQWLRDNTRDHYIELTPKQIADLNKSLIKKPRSSLEELER